MNFTQSSLVIVGANTPEAKVFWDGQSVEFVKLTVDTFTGKVVLHVREDPKLAAMKAAGITIVRRS